MGSGPPSDGGHQRRADRESVLAGISRQALAGDDLDTLFEDATRSVIEALGADSGVLLERLPDGNELHVRVAVGDPGVTDPVAADAPWVAPALAGSGPTVVDGDRTPNGVDGPVVGASVGETPPWGVLCVCGAGDRAFADAEVAFVERVAGVLAAAVENDRAQTELEEIYGRISDAFFALDEDWRFSHVNDRAHDLINVDDRTLVGKNVWEEFPKAVERSFKPEYERAMHDQETVVFEEYYPEPLDTWFEVRAYPSETGLSVYFQDVTDRKRREQELRRYETIFDAVDEGVYVIDDDLQFRMVNDAYADLLGYDPSDLVGEHASKVADGSVIERAREADSRLRAGEEDPTVFEADLVRADGDTVPVEATFSLLSSEDGDRLRVGVVRDVSNRKERERELRRKERRYQAIFEDPNILVGLLAPDGTVLDINETAMEYVDADLDAITGEPFWETPWWGEGDGVGEDVREWVDRAAAGEYVDFEADLTRPDGEPYTLDGVFRPVTNDDGEVVSIIVSDRDVTERVEANRKVEESERRYRTIAEYFPNGIVTLFDHDLRYELAAGKGFEKVDVDQSSVEGKHFSEVWGEETAEKLRPAFEAALDGEERQVELEYLGRDWVLYGVPITDERGDVFAGMTMAQDITERKEAQRKLEESERRYRTLAERFPNGAVGVYDDDLRYTLAEGTVLGETLPSSDELEGMRLPEAFPDDTVADLEPMFRAAIDEGETGNTTTEFGGRHWRVWATPLRDADGEIFAGLSFTQDVTEQVERQRKLEESNDRLQQFAYAASHDLQEPLRMVSSYVQLIERRYGDELGEEGREYVDFAVDGVERMREMIHGLLAYSRVDTRGDPFEPVDLDDVFDDVREDLRLRIEESDAEIAVGDLPRVTGDEGQLRQVFQNLVDNAIEYSGDDRPRIEVDARRDGDRWVVSVADEGIGIDADDPDRVFDVFQRLHTREEHPGTGIGLALCERIVERHGGEIWVESEPGEGATFSFTLPAVDE